MDPSINDFYEPREPESWKQWLCPLCEAQNTDFGKCSTEGCLGQKEHPICFFCREPLGAFEISLKHQWHKECQVCEICKHEVTFDMAQRAFEKDTKLTHSTCFESRTREELAKKPVTITREMLDHYNNVLLLFEPDNSLSIETNQMIAANNLRQSKWFNDKDWESKYMVLKRMEALCATVRIIIDESKSKDSIIASIKKRDIEKMKEVKEAREAPERERVAKAPSVRSLVKAIPGLDPLRADAIVKREKAIAALMKVPGTTREMAERMLDASKPN